MNLDRLHLRAKLLARARRFFEQAGVLEVETPILSTSTTTDPHIESLCTRLRHRPGIRHYLHTSPEFAMKRLLAEGCGDIYQICKVFRDGELGKNHRPEFTLLEWYRLAYDDAALAIEVDQLLRTLLEGYRSVGPLTWVSYGDALFRVTGISPNADTRELQRAATELGMEVPESADASGLLDWLFATRVAPTLGKNGPCVIHDFPIDQAALARIKPDGKSAARFEIFFQGAELANGFHELLDSEEQLHRFERELEQRRASGAREIPIDRNFLSALERGLPDCAGVALGFDRVLMLAANTQDIADVLSIDSI